MSAAREWNRLRSRYGSNKQYKNRVAIYPSQTEEFKNFLVDIGADAFSFVEKDELVRFRMDGKIGVVWITGSGNLLAHDCANRFKSEV